MPFLRTYWREMLIGLALLLALPVLFFPEVVLGGLSLFKGDPYENPKALPRAYLAYQVEVAANHRAALSRVADRDFDLGRMKLREQEVFDRKNHLQEANI